MDGYSVEIESPRLREYVDFWLPNALTIQTSWMASTKAFVRFEVTLALFPFWLRFGYLVNLSIAIIGCPFACLFAVFKIP